MVGTLLGSPCPLNVGVQDLVTELQKKKTTLRGTEGRGEAGEGKKQRLVKVL